MNIVDALKHNRPLRRMGQGWGWRTADWWRTHGRFTVQDITADDWEVQPETKQITRDKFFEVAHILHMDRNCVIGGQGSFYASFEECCNIQWSNL